MNRRDFLIGCAATAAATCTIPTIADVTSINVQEWYDQWLTDTAKVWTKYHEDLFLYGRAAILQIDTYPYIKSVPIEEWIEGLGGLQRS